MYLALWLIRRCRLPATPAFSLPDAVILKRFLAPDFVFSFGISRRSLEAPSSCRVYKPPWHALSARRFPKGVADTRKPGPMQGDPLGQGVAGSGRSRKRPPGGGRSRASNDPAAQRGARIMIICRPSMRGSYSTLAI